MNNPDRRSTLESLTRYGGILVLCLFALGGLNPGDLLWGVNHLAFLAPWQSVALIGLAAALLLIPTASSGVIKAADSILRRAMRTRVTKGAACALVFVIATAVFYFLRIKTNFYGDTRWILHLSRTNIYPLSDIFRVSATEPLAIFIYQSVRLTLGIEPSTAYQVVNSLVGGVFVVALCAFVTSLKTSNAVRLAILVLFASSGFNQVFFGHVENYAPAAAATVFSLILGWRLFDTGKGIWVMVLFFLVGIRLHVEMILFLPGLLYAIVFSLVSRGVLSGAWIKPRIAVIGTALILLGATALYFLHFNAARAETADMEIMIRKVFLPIVTNVPELNGYTLFSGDHLHDVLQVLLLVSSPSIVLVIVLGIIGRRDARWGSPRMVFLSLCAGFFIFFTFMMNPVLTITRDWDLFALGGIPLAFLAMAVVLEYNASSHEAFVRRRIVPMAFALGMLSATFFVVNGFEESIGERLRSLGCYLFKSSHRKSSELINIGSNYILNLDDQIVEREQTIARLEPHRLKNDRQFSFLEQKLAEAYYQKGDFRKTDSHLIRAMAADTAFSEPLKLRGLLSLKMGRLDEGTALLDRYNQSYNDPFVQDEIALLGIETANYLRFLEANGADERQLQEVRVAIEIIPRQ